MPEKRIITWDQVYAAADELMQSILALTHQFPIRIFPIPRGGVHAAQALLYVAARKRCDKAGLANVFELTSVPTSADYILDDLVDSGRTRDKWKTRYPTIKFESLFEKLPDDQQRWFVFPWEGDEKDGPLDAVTRLLQFIGDDPKREGLLETPQRVIRSYAELFSGYKADPKEIIKTFASEADEMVISRDIEFYSTCEHHMLPFIGKAHIGYIPKGQVIGISKLARLLEIYSRRLQIQEQLTVQITKALDDHLQPLGSACLIEAKHLCMSCRGVNKQHASMVTSSLTGAFREPAVRAEFFSLIKS